MLYPKLTKVEVNPSGLCHDIVLEISGERKYKLSHDVEILHHLKGEGVIHTRVKAGATFDGRSGGPVVDLLLPNVGDQLYRRGWFGHDSHYSFAAYCATIGVISPVSFDLANNLYLQTNELPRRLGGAGFSKPRSWLAWKGVQSKFGRDAYEHTDGFDKRNFGLVDVRWLDK